MICFVFYLRLSSTLGNQELKGICLVPKHKALQSSGQQHPTIIREAWVQTLSRPSPLHMHVLKTNWLLISIDARQTCTFFYCRSDSGVVNIYDNQRLDQTQPKPLKAIMNLTTSINNVAFNSTRQVFSMSTTLIKNCICLS